jgi:hypothetical protein
VLEKKVELTPPSGNDDDDDTLLIAVVVVTAGDDLEQESSSVVFALQANPTADVGLSPSLSSSLLLNVRFRLDGF